MNLFGKLAGELSGEADERPPLVLLHGLTFDRTMWGPALDELRSRDRGRQVLTLDLPGHGESPGWPRYGVEDIADAVGLAVQEAGLRPPVLAGHSYSAVLASFYAGTHPVTGVINVDQWLQTRPMSEMMQSLAPRLHSPAFPGVWQFFFDSMHIELLPPAAQELVRSSCDPRQELVTGYWREIIETPADEMAARAESGLARLGAAGTPYLFVAGHQPEPEYEAWLRGFLPQVSIAVLADSGHFPHLAHPGLFAGCLADTAQWPPG